MGMLPFIYEGNWSAVKENEDICSEIESIL